MMYGPFLTRSILLVTIIISQLLKFTNAAQGCKPRGQGTEGFDMSLYHYDYYDPAAGPGFCFSSEYQSHDYMHGGYVTWAGGLFGTSSKITDLALDFKLPELCTITNGTLPDNFNYAEEFTISNFTMLLTGYFYAEMTGNYNFQLEADDLAYLSFGAGNAFDCCGMEQSVTDPDAFDLIVIWKDTDDLSGNVTFSLNEGVYYPLRLLYTNRDFYGVLSLKYTDPSGVLHSDFSDQIFQFPDSPGGCANDVHYTTTVWTGTYTTTYSTTVFTSIGSDGYGTIETIYYIETPTPTNTVVSSSTVSSEVESSSFESSSFTPSSLSTVESSSTIVSSQISSGISTDILSSSVTPPSASTIESSSTIVSSQISSSMSTDIRSSSVTPPSTLSSVSTVKSSSTIVSSTSVNTFVSSEISSISNSEYISSVYSSIITSGFSSSKISISSNTILIPSSIPTNIKELSSESFSGSSKSASHSISTESRYTNQTTTSEIEATSTHSSDSTSSTSSTTLTSSVSSASSSPESFNSISSTDTNKSSNTILTSSMSLPTSIEESTTITEDYSMVTSDIKSTARRTEFSTKFTDVITSIHKSTTTILSPFNSETSTPVTRSVSSTSKSFTGSTSMDIIETHTPKNIISRDSSKTFTTTNSASTEIVKWFSTTIESAESSSLTYTNSIPTNSPSSTSINVLYNGSANKEKLDFPNIVATIIYLVCFI